MHEDFEPLAQFTARQRPLRLDLDREAHAIACEQQVVHHLREGRARIVDRQCNHAFVAQARGEQLPLGNLIGDAVRMRLVASNPASSRAGDRSSRRK